MPWNIYFRRRRIVFSQYLPETEKEKIDTFYLDTVNKGEVNITCKEWGFDTVKFEQGNFIFREDFKYERTLFLPIIFERLIQHQRIEDFEIGLIDNIIELSNSLKDIYKTKESYAFEFKFQQKSKEREMYLKVSESLINIDYSFINEAQQFLSK